MKRTSTTVIGAAALALASIAGAEPLVVDWTGPSAIADLGQVSIPLDAVADGATVQSVTVAIQLTHPWIGDLRATLSHEAATATLFDQLAPAASPFACGGDDIDAAFTDAAVALPDVQCAPNVAPTIVGDVLPADPLGVFAGLPADGVWTLTFDDLAQFDDGTIDAISLTIELVPSPGCVGDINGDGSTDVFDFSDLAANFGAGPGATLEQGDITGDGFVDVFDFSELAADFGCSS